MIIPYGITAKDWFSSLIIDFPDEQIPILEKEEDWKLIGNILKTNSRFAEIPDTSEYNDWRDYAYDFYCIMENES